MVISLVIVEILLIFGECVAQTLAKTAIHTGISLVVTEIVENLVCLAEKHCGLLGCGLAHSLVREY